MYISKVSKQEEKGYTDTTIGIQICEGQRCNEKLETLQSGSPFAFQSVNIEETMNPQQRWCLGQCSGDIPDFSFTLKEHAKLIGKVLEFHGLNAKLCHFIYVGVGVRVERKEIENN